MSTITSMLTHSTFAQLTRMVDIPFYPEYRDLRQERRRSAKAKKHQTRRELRLLRHRFNRAAKKYLTDSETIPSAHRNRAQALFNAFIKAGVDDQLSVISAVNMDDHILTNCTPEEAVEIEMSYWHD
jgi:ribosome recycling factor